MTRKTISVFLCSSVRFNSHSLQFMATIQKSQWLCFLQPSLTEIRVCSLKRSLRYFDIYIFFFSNNICRCWQQNQQGNKINELEHKKMSPQLKKKNRDTLRKKQSSRQRAGKATGSCTESTNNSQIKVCAEGIIG